MTSPGRHNAHARRLFNGVADNYERTARLFSLFQYERWHRFLVSRLDLPPGSVVLDVCTGTGLVAAEISRRHGCQVIGLDLSERMIARARRGLLAASPTPAVSLVRGRAEGLPISDGSCDAVVFTFLLRYVEDPQTTLGEIARVLRPGGRLASLEFYVPGGPVLHPLWLAYTRLVMPLAMRVVSAGWSEVGQFLGPSISGFYRRHSLEDLTAMWTRAGIGEVRTRVLSLGGAVVTWGRKEA